MARRRARKSSLVDLARPQTHPAPDPGGDAIGDLDDERGGPALRADGRGSPGPWETDPRVARPGVELEVPDLKVGEIEQRPGGAGVEPQVKRYIGSEPDLPVRAPVEPWDPVRGVLAKLDAPLPEVAANHATFEHPVDEVARGGSPGRQVTRAEPDANAAGRRPIQLDRQMFLRTAAERDQGSDDEPDAEQHDTRRPPARQPLE